MAEINKRCDYVVIANIFESPEVSVLIGYKGENNLDNLYVINEFEYKKEELETFKELFSIYDSPQKPKEFVDFFVENDKFYSVFKYVETEDISRKFRFGFNAFSFDDRCTFLEDILIRIDKIKNFPAVIRGCLTEPENLRVDEEKNIHLIYNLKNIVKYKSEDAEDLIAQNISNIIYILLKPEADAKFNKSLHIVIDKCKRRVYRSIPEMVIDLKKAEKICKTSSWWGYFKHQLGVHKSFIKQVAKAGIYFLLLSGGVYLLYSKLTEGQRSGTAPTAVTIGEISYTGDVEDDSDKTVSTENVDNQTGSESNLDIVLSEGLDIDYEDYIVQYGDTIASICSNYYKDSKYITAIASFNGIGTDEKLTAGTILKLPNRTAIALYISK